MDKEEFNSMVKKYRDELQKYIKKNKSHLDNDYTYNKENKPYEVHKTTDNSDVTYKEFMDNNSNTGTLKIESFCEDEIPLSGVRVRIKKNFADGERIFFDGYTNEKGNIDNILLPAPDHNVLKGSDQNICPNAVYDVEVSHDNYDIDCKDNVRTFSHIETVYPIKITLPKD